MIYAPHDVHEKNEQQPKIDINFFHESVDDARERCLIKLITIYLIRQPFSSSSRREMHVKVNNERVLMRKRSTRTMHICEISRKGGMINQ